MVLWHSTLRKEFEFAESAMQWNLCLRFVFMVMVVIFAIVMLGFVESNGHKVICALEIGKVDKAAEDVNGILVDISSEVRSRSEIRSVLNQKFSPSGGP